MAASTGTATGTGVGRAGGPGAVGGQAGAGAWGGWQTQQHQQNYAAASAQWASHTAFPAWNGSTYGTGVSAPAVRYRTV